MVKNQDGSKTIGQEFTTTYGTVTVNADGSYTYAADQSGSMSLSDGATAVDVLHLYSKRS